MRVARSPKAGRGCLAIRHRHLRQAKTPLIYGQLVLLEEFNPPLHTEALRPTRSKNR